ncbi:MAG TPA: sigma-70 family RNA polymerase sigma factor [Sedimentisphaerales bacterium]|nr:sigma-70 family RNA polymerase sigma factor [Sedimentisphaerales bacterium]
MNGFSDDILVAASARGDKGAYGILVRRHYSRVFGVCLGMLGNVADAEDIAQDTMLKGFLQIKRLRRTERFDSWVLQIAKNLCVDVLRRRKHIKAFAAEQCGRPGDATNEYHDLQEAIRQLPKEFRLPLVMYYFDNKSAKAIAEKLNISHSGVCQRIRVARKLLHELLTEGGA